MAAVLKKISPTEKKIHPTPRPTPVSLGHESPTRSNSTVSLTPSQQEAAVLEILGLASEGAATKGPCNANPITSAGKKIQLFQIQGLALVPITLLFSLCGAIFGMKLNDHMATKDIHDTIGFSIQLCETIHVLQKERDLSSLYVGLTGQETKHNLIEQYTETDEAVQNFFLKTTTNNKRSVISRQKLVELLSSHRYQLELMNATQQKEMSFYTGIIKRLQDQFVDSISEASTGIVWKLLVALNEVMICKELFGIERGYGSLYFSGGGFKTNTEYLYFADAQDVADVSLFEARKYSSTIEEIYLKNVAGKEVFIDTISDKRFMARYDPFGENMGPGSRENATDWYDNMSLYINSLLDMQNDIIYKIQVILDQEMDAEVAVIVLLGVIIVIVIVVSPVILKGVYNVTAEMQGFSGSLVEMTMDLNREKSRTNSLLHALMPKHIAKQLVKQRSVEAESYEEATVFFSDIEGFTAISAGSSPQQIIEMLDLLYKCFDENIDKYDVYKIETIGDAYMVVSGVPTRNEHRHALEIAKLSLDLLEQIQDLVVPHMPAEKMKLRVGVHSGPVVAGVVGHSMLRYCIFGETVVIASKLESTGKAGKVHISASTQAIISAYSKQGEFSIVKRADASEVNIPKLPFETFWLMPFLKKNSMSSMCDSWPEDRESVEPPKDNRRKGTFQTRPQQLLKTADGKKAKK